MWQDGERWVVRVERQWQGKDPRRHLPPLEAWEMSRASGYCRGKTREAEGSHGIRGHRMEPICLTGPYGASDLYSEQQAASLGSHALASTSKDCLGCGSDTRFSIHKGRSRETDVSVVQAWTKADTVEG